MTRHLDRLVLRTRHNSDEALTSLQLADWPWQSPTRARFLVKASMNTGGRHYHLTRRINILHTPKQTFCNLASCGTLTTCKVLANFALGEAYYNVDTGCWLGELI